MLDDHLYAEAKKFAAETGRTFSSVVEDALREALSRRAPPTVVNVSGFLCSKAEGVCSPASIWTIPPPSWTGWKAWMVLIDVNVFVYAYRPDSPDHGLFLTPTWRRWRPSRAASGSPPIAITAGVLALSLSGRIRWCSFQS